MKTLFFKEVQLLRPAFIAALLLAAAPGWIVPVNVRPGPPEVAIWSVFIGLLCLSLSTFGREFSLNTFSLMMAQPVSREKIWRAKMASLAAGAIAVILVGCLSFGLSSRLNAPTADGDSGPSDVPALIAMLFVVLVGGLWPALLLRQMASAIWIAMAAPLALLAVLALLNAPSIVVFLMLASYSAVAYVIAKRQFHRAQETSWTGGEIGLRWFQYRAAARQIGERRFSPLLAILTKELRLYLIPILGMALFFHLNLAVVFIRSRLGMNSNQGGAPIISELALEFFSALWFAAPLMLSGIGVAEERRLGTLDVQQSLPVTRRMIFAVKFLFSVLLGGCLSAFLVWLAEGIGNGIGAGGLVGGFAVSLNGKGLIPLLMVFSFFALIVFYASTLTRNLLQSVTVAISAIVLLGVMDGVVTWQFVSRFSSRALPLLSVVSYPAITAAILWLSWRNFRTFDGTRKIWEFNVAALALIILCTTSLVAGIYDRAWELFMPLEAARGPARLAAGQQAKMETCSGCAAIVLPDGRLWLDRLAYDAGRTVWDSSNGFADIKVGGAWMTLPGNRMAPGTNWTAAAANIYEFAALRSDGTLWVSGKPVRQIKKSSDRNRLFDLQAPADLVQVGSDANWKDIARLNYGDMLLLKSDGTLWQWGQHANVYKTGWTGLANEPPTQIAGQAGWNRMLFDGENIFAWKTNGEAWELYDSRGDAEGKDHSNILVGQRRWPEFDHFQWRSLAYLRTFPESYEIAVRDDGSLWLCDFDFWRKGGVREFRQIGSESNWASVATGDQSVCALKTDGSLWTWTEWSGHVMPAVHFKRLGSGNDWVAASVASFPDSGPKVASLAADGSLWCWTADRNRDWTEWLRPSRRPDKATSLFDSAETK